MWGFWGGNKMIIIFSGIISLLLGLLVLKLAAGAKNWKEAVGAIGILAGLGALVFFGLGSLDATDSCAMLKQERSTLLFRYQLHTEMGVPYGVIEWIEFQKDIFNFNSKLQDYNYHASHPLTNWMWPKSIQKVQPIGTLRRER
jgi:hypothetical protein